MDLDIHYNHVKNQSLNNLDSLMVIDSMDSLYFTKNIISHSLWNCGGSHVTTGSKQCVPLRQFSVWDTSDLTDQLRSQVYVAFRTEICCLLEKQHRSAHDKHQSRSKVTIGDEEQIRTCSYSVKSLRVQGRPGSLGFMFLTDLHAFVNNQNISLQN